jgi:hypothetical protein
MSTDPRLVKVAKDDEDWVTPEQAAEVLQRAHDGSEPVSHATLQAELAEMERRGL